MMTETSSEILPEQVDIAIVGAGLTGLCLAMFLASQQASWKILLVEASASDHGSISEGGESGIVDNQVNDQPDKQPVDHRQIALAESSRRLFLNSGLMPDGLWQEIEQHAAAITEIHVSDRGHPGHSQLIAIEQGLDSYGHVIDAKKLATLLSAAVDRLDNVQRISCSGSLTLGAVVLKPKTNGMVVQLGDASIFTQLTLLANGEQPEQAQRLGIQFKRKDYGRFALTAELTLSKPHRGIAYERFTSKGPIALLPLPDAPLPNDSLPNEKGSPRASLVWTMAPEQARQLLASAEDDFIARLQACFGDRAGQIKAVTHRALVPLSKTLASEQVRSHLALMGTAAHSLHPVAGQGFNLTLRDIANLCAVLSRAQAGAGKLGDLSTLQRYEQDRAADQLQIVNFSDALPALFASTNPFMSAARNIGLLGLELAPALRGSVARFGAGLAVREVQLND